METPAARATSFMLAPSKPALRNTERAPSMIWRSLAPPSFRAATSCSGASQFHSHQGLPTTESLTERFGSIFRCFSPRFGLSQRKMTEPFGRYCISRLGFSMDEPINVAEQSPATASRAITAATAAPGVPAPRPPAFGGPPAAPARRGQALGLAPIRSSGRRRWPRSPMAARRPTTISSRAASWFRPTTPMSAPRPRSSPPRRPAI